MAGSKRQMDHAAAVSRHYPVPEKKAEHQPPPVDLPTPANIIVEFITP